MIATSLSKIGLLFFLATSTVSGGENLSLPHSKIGMKCVETASHVPNPPELLECNSEKFSVFTDLLYWRAEEGATSWVDVLLIADPLSEQQLSVDFDWNWGFRGGVGYNLDYDDWDTVLSYTWFRTKGTSSAEVSPFRIGTLSTQFLGGFIVEHVFQEAHIQWSILYNMFDWDLGRTFSLSPVLNLRPFIGAKGGWIHQKITSQWIDHSFTARENLLNNFWGVGPNGGVNTQWRLNRNPRNFFALFEDVSAAFMWGEWDCGDNYSNSNSEHVNVNTPTTRLGALSLRAYSGIGWNFSFNRDRSKFSIRLGYEGQFWFNQLKTSTFDELRLNHDLTFQGGTLDCRFDF